MKEKFTEHLEKRTMSELETHAFLQKHGVQPLDLKNFKQHEPLLYVFEEIVRDGEGPLSKFPKEKRPSIVRVDDPGILDLKSPRIDDTRPNRTIYPLENNGGQVDYYAIEYKTNKIIHVKTSANIKTALTLPYFVTKAGLYTRNDELFPKVII